MTYKSAFPLYLSSIKFLFFNNCRGVLALTLSLFILADLIFAPV